MAITPPFLERALSRSVKTHDIAFVNLRYFFRYFTINIVIFTAFFFWCKFVEKFSAKHVLSLIGANVSPSRLDPKEKKYRMRAPEGRKRKILGFLDVKNAGFCCSKAKFAVQFV